MWQERTAAVWGVGCPEFVTDLVQPRARFRSNVTDASIRRAPHSAPITAAHGNQQGPARSISHARKGNAARHTISRAARSSREIPRDGDEPVICWASLAIRHSWISRGPRIPLFRPWIATDARLHRAGRMVLGRLRSRSNIELPAFVIMLVTVVASDLLMARLGLAICSCQRTIRL